MTYSYAEEHAKGHHSRHRSSIANRTLTVKRDLTVEEGAPQLKALVGKWHTHVWNGRRKDEIKICDRITMIADEPYVHVERKYPWTGGVIPVKSIVIPEPMALGFPICTAIVVYVPKEKTAW